MAVDQSTIDDAIIQQYLADSSLTATADPSGIYYYPTVSNPAGNDQSLGSILTIYYTARVLNGQVIEIVTADDSVKLKQGASAVYPVGLDIGLVNMREGETFVFILPSSLALGTFTFSTLIPANSILEIEVGLLQIQNELDVLTEEQNLINTFIVNENLNDTIANPINSVDALTSGIFYKRRTVGISNDVLLPGDLASFSYRGMFLDDLNNVFDATVAGETFDYTFMSGTIIPGIEAGLDVMERNEEAWLIIPSGLAYKESAFVIPSYLSDEFVELDIIPQYAAKIQPYKVVLFETTLR